MNLSCMPNKRSIYLGWAFIIALSLYACGNGGGDVPPKEAGYSQTHNWQRITIAQVDVSGTTIPFVVAKQAPDRNVHMAYYSGETAPDGYQYQRLNYLIWDPSANSTTRRFVNNRTAPSGMDGFDDCDQFDLALDDSTPVLIYPTYQIHPTNLQVESDIMINLFDGSGWNETTGAVGWVERNPVFRDGHANENMSVAVDSLGNIHVAYQFFYEGIDSANGSHPDLFYVYRDSATLNDPMTLEDFSAIEEQVEGNRFTTYAVHNSVGFACDLVVDPDDRPVIAYGRHDNSFNGTFALKVAYKNDSGGWDLETVDTLDDGWKVDAVSAAYFPPDPEEDPEDPETERPLAIAYALRSPAPEPDDSHRLMFAVKREGQWAIELVDETTWCGGYCSLAFTPEGLPAIAYLDEMSHSGRTHQYLKYAEFNGVLWSKESAEEEGIVGRHNSLWFDAAGRPNISTYSEEENEILVIRQIN